MVKRYLFFLRHYNDIDNIAPVIYYFLKESEENRADVIIYSGDYDYTKDKNLNFIKSIFPDRFSCTWLGSYFGLRTEKINLKNLNINEKPVIIGFKKKMGAIYNYIFKVVRYPLSFFIKHLKVADNPTDVIIPMLCAGRGGTQLKVSSKIQEILEEYTYPSLVIFDVNRTPRVIGLLQSLRHNGIKRIICLPVSPLINYNTFRSYDIVNIHSKEFKEIHDYSGFDAVGFVDNYFVESYTRTHEVMGLQSSLQNKTKALGTLRFCREWLSIRDTFINKFDYPTNKIKVILLLSDPLSNVNETEIYKIFELLSLFQDYEVVVKHHTRFKQRKRVFNKLNKYNNIKFFDDVESTSLIEWAEIVLYWSTSVAIEGFVKNKTMVCLDYVSGNKNLYELFDAGYIVRCRDDLHEFLSLYKIDKGLIKYNKIGVQNLLSIFIGSQDDLIIKKYLDFMESNELRTL